MKVFLTKKWYVNKHINNVIATTIENLKPTERGTLTNKPGKNKVKGKCNKYTQYDESQIYFSNELWLFRYLINTPINP